ncbi:Ig-like domain-containing protein [Clostridium estertheticum]|uniref:Ig-like domain-containing protein n=1 Tax=Clostridium estertheticum TaxID=238834 RepID=UPI001C0C12DD|nr:Ig-like domain-containing protein [Clostridium estertheticum]MBU3172760.1 Ig-like domain-containing protein [Clostridium estertheticum]
MKKKVINSVFVALIIAGTTSFSAFATMANGSVVIGNKSFDLAYANDIKNSTEITNAIVGGGAIYVKDFSGNWIDNTTGKTVDASIVPGENGGQETILAVMSVNAIDDTKNINDSYTLPTTVTATLSDGTTKDLAVTWNKVASTKVAGTYTFVGSLTMVDGAINTNNINVSATLNIVSDISSITDNTDITSKFTDENFRNKVYGKIGKTSPEPILYSDVKKLKELNVGYGYISNLSGIEYFTALNTLYCHDNQLTTLDVSKNMALSRLDCGFNQLKTLDVTKNTELTDLDCEHNKLTSLVTKNTALTDLDCIGNQLTTLDVSKNTALSQLKCEYNQLTTLDITKNTALYVLECEFNKLTTLDLSKNMALHSLWCEENQLTTLDVSKNMALNDLWCHYNQITTLYSTRDTWNTVEYRPQYIDLRHTITTDGLVITIKQ